MTEFSDVEYRVYETIRYNTAEDVDYWYDFEVATRNVAHFEGLRHPVH
jgi:hypothetical protein